MLLQMEQQHCEVEPSATSVTSSHAGPASGVVKSEPEPAFDSGNVMKDAISSEQNDESANNIVLESAADGVLDSPEELKPADDIEGMAS